MASLRRETVAVSQEIFDNMWLDRESDKVAGKDKTNRNNLNMIEETKLIINSWKKFKEINSSLFPAFSSFVAGRRFSHEDMFKTLEKQRMMLSNLLKTQIYPQNISKDPSQIPSSLKNEFATTMLIKSSPGKYNTTMISSENNATNNKLGADFNQKIEVEAVINENMEHVMNSIEHLRQV
ncbi:hypothetical protein LSTR_LSTR010912 [Laodelphax striatellus]|uniref:Uncharacterized protein n=1 Tax=Laodelphax striatellus TaxID=195883 RepID=A0A482WYD2_LAOST|nr:hypothetical protein LSTR_LSTR010912 [Laodelphax striatellus]